MNAPLRIGIVGIGRMGQRHALNLAHRTLGAELVAACSLVEAELQWAREKLGVKHSYRDYTELLAHPGLDTVLGDLPLPLTLRDATEATRIGIALAQSLRSGRAVDVK